MEIECVGFYPEEKKLKKGNKTLGTLHIYVPDMDMDIRGIKVIQQRNNKYFFEIPYMIKFDTEEKKPVKFPIISFCSRKTQETFIESLIKNGAPFIKQELKSMKKVRYVRRY